VQTGKLFLKKSRKNIGIVFVFLLGSFRDMKFEEI